MKSKNDLTQFEKNLLRTLNFFHGTNYNYQHLSEWSSNESAVLNNLEQEEKIYFINGIYISINPNKLERYRK